MPTPGPGLDHVKPPAKLSAGTLLGRCDIPVDFVQSYTRVGRDPKHKVADDLT